MEAAVVGVGKAALNALLSGAKSTIAEETALTQAFQRDMVFLADELEEMRSTLRDVVQERDYRKVPRSRVNQLRSLAYDVEDCLQDHSVHLEKPSGWHLARTVLERHRIAAEMKGLRARVEDMNQRNLHHQLMHNARSKHANTIEHSGQSNISATEMFGIHEEGKSKARWQKNKPKVDLSQLIINKENEDLRVIAVWGAGGVLGQTVVIKGAYDDLKRSKVFELYAWIRIVHPFSPLEFLECIMRQFYQISFEEARKTQEKTNIGAQVLKKMGLMKQDDLVDAFSEHVNDKSYLIVLNDLSTVEEWDVIKEYFPDNKKGSRIILSTEHGEVASLCTGQESIVSELNQPSVDQSIFASHNKASQNQTALMEPGSSSNETILGTNNSVMPTDVIVENQFVGDNAKIAKESLSRLGTMACALEESQLVGREKEKSELISLISKQDDQQTMVISVWGMGGLGKTTLVKEVYQSQELSDLFEKRAFVTIMHPFDPMEVLKSLAMQLCVESFNRKDNIDFRRSTLTDVLTEELGKVTETMRCLIILDDLSSVREWEVIIQYLHKMENASRIVITTREESIAKQASIYKLYGLNQTDALDLFTRKVFSKAINLEERHPALIEEAKTILNKCNGHPLAILTIGGFLAKQQKTVMHWRKLNEHISAELEMNTELELNTELGIIRAFLVTSYDGLPYVLRSCFLYLSIFPEHYNISRRRLVGRWNAEGYSSMVCSWTVREIADTYFMGLIDRSMVLPSKEPTSSRKGISSCKLHDLMHQISIAKAMQEDFVFRMELGNNFKTQGTIRHLAISSNCYWEVDQSEFERAGDLSRIRSLTVFGMWKPFFISDKMKWIRVLDLESTSGLMDHHLEPIWKLLHLKYLSLRGCRGISYLPKSLGNLKQLETLDVTGTRIIKLPQAVTKLTKLQYIRAGNVYNEFSDVSSYDELEDDDSMNRHDLCTMCCPTVFPFLARLEDPIGVAVPRGIRKLKDLHTLGAVNIARGGKAILQDIKRLTQLVKLAVTGINKENCEYSWSTLSNLIRLESLSVHCEEEEGIGDSLDNLYCAWGIQSLKLYGALGKLPQRVTDLQHLVKLKLEGTKITDVEGTMQVIGKLPNLTILRLLHGSFEEEVPSYFTSRGEAFPSLKVLETGWRTGIESVVFEEGTAPKLELLLARGPISFSGLSCLPRLKEAMIHKSLVGNVQPQLRRNQNKPILKFV